MKDFSAPDCFKETLDVPAAEIVLSAYGLLRQSDGRRYSGICPFHPGEPQGNESRKRPFMVSVDENAFSCEVCGRKGTLPDLKVQLERVDPKNAGMFIYCAIESIRYRVKHPSPYETPL